MPERPASSKRLLIDAGSPLPETLEIRADPATDSPREYHWDGITLIDNPGFQSSDSAHDESALRSLSDASAIVYLFQPNLIVGDDEYMTTVLKGSEDHGVDSKLSHTFFVVNRSDELGVDPADDLGAYRQLVQRKQSELSAALSKRNIAVTPDRVLCMASDPYGLVGVEPMSTHRRSTHTAIGMAFDSSPPPSVASSRTCSDLDVTGRYWEAVWLDCRACRLDNMGSSQSSRHRRKHSLDFRHRSTNRSTREHAWPPSTVQILSVSFRNTRPGSVMKCSTSETRNV